jgi:release factor glutamine methyltransferase
MREVLAERMVSPHPHGERSREARVRGLNPLKVVSPSPQPSRQGGEGAGCTLRQAFIEAAAALRAAGKETPELDARILLCHAAGVTQEAYVASPEALLAEDDSQRFRAMLARRLAGEPVSRITGAKEFYWHLFMLDRHTLDPRPDTETLIDAVLDMLTREGRRDEPLRILDLGTGTGCILLTLLAELPHATGVGSDKSDEALEVAQRNAVALDVARRARFVSGDWFEPIDGTFDVVVSNPPYIPTADIAGLAPEVRHDPRLALDGGVDGLDAYRKIVQGVRNVLAPEGVLFLEVGEGQAAAVLGLCKDAGLKTVLGGPLWTDLAGRERCVAGRFG